MGPKVVRWKGSTGEWKTGRWGDTEGLNTAPYGINVNREYIPSNLALMGSGTGLAASIIPIASKANLVDKFQEEMNHDRIYPCF